MKKKLLCLIICGAMMLTPISVCADEKDDYIAELETQIEELQSEIESLKAELEKEKRETVSTSQEIYKIGEPWIVENLLKITIDSVEEVKERSDFSEQNPAAVYIITYTYENLGKKEDLFVTMDETVIDNDKKMGYPYPLAVDMYPQYVPMGARCEAQVCIGLDNPGDFTLRTIQYDDNFNKYEAFFEIQI